MMNNMMGGMMQSMFGFGSGFGSGGMMRGMGGDFGGGACSFSCQSFSFSSSIQSDGRVHTEQFSSSTVADPSRRIRETKQAYANSSSRCQKMSLERQMGAKGHKIVQERQGGEDRRTEMLNGVEDAEGFEDEWRQNAAPHLPSHRVALQLGSNSSSSWGRDDGEVEVAGSEGTHHARALRALPGPHHEDHQEDDLPSSVPSTRYGAQRAFEEGDEEHWSGQQPRSNNLNLRRGSRAKPY